MSAVVRRRSLIAALGAALPFGLGGRRAAACAADGPALRFRSFEETVRAAFAGQARGPSRRRVAVGHCDLLTAGIQGCQNDRPFAGFAAGRLRIVRAGSEPGPRVAGVRLYVTTVDVALVDGPSSVAPGRPLDFAALPPAPVLG